jgi:MinD superfamily P-loop ATPase
VNEIVVLSGKGGTGKTSLTAVFSVLMNRAVLVDCDVDAANLHLLLKPVVEKRHEFIAGAKARVSAETCRACGTCVEACRFGAIILDGIAAVNPLRCEGCGLCAHVCPNGAISLQTQACGEWFASRTLHGPMFHAKMVPGADNSGKLVSTLRQAARAHAANSHAEWILVDGPPGSGCPVISSLTGADYVVLVSEPTVSGYADLQRAAAVAVHFRVPVGVIVNKADINLEIARNIEEYAISAHHDVLGRIAYDPAFTAAQRAGVVVLETASAQLRDSLEGVWHSVEKAVRRRKPTFAVLP